MLKYCFIWFLKGPFAYSNIVDFVDNSMKMTKIGRKILDLNLKPYIKTKRTEDKKT